MEVVCGKWLGGGEGIGVVTQDNSTFDFRGCLWCRGKAVSRGNHFPLNDPVITIARLFLQRLHQREREGFLTPVNDASERYSKWFIYQPLSHEFWWKISSFVDALKPQQSRRIPRPPALTLTILSHSLFLKVTSRTRYLMRCMEANIAPRAHIIIRKTHTTKVTCFLSIGPTNERCTISYNSCLITFPNLCASMSPLPRRHSMINAIQCLREYPGVFQLEGIIRPRTGL